MNRLIQRALFYLGSYTGWILGFRLLVLTLITYFSITSSSRFQEISETFAANELMLMGLGALLYLVLLLLLNPMTSTTIDEVYTRYRVTKKFAPGFLHGAVLAAGIVTALLLSGVYRYLGFFIQADEAPLAMAGFLVRTASLIALVYAEEFVFRQKFMNYIRSRVPELGAVAISAAVYCGVKYLQFDLGISQLMTLFLVGVCLSIRTIADGDFARGAGFWAGMLIVFHPLLSLPVLGNEFQGLLLVRYQASDPAFDDGTARLISGGLGGPLSSFSLQLIFLLDIAQGIYRNKKILLNPRPRRLKSSA